MKAKLLLSLLFTLCASSLWAVDVNGINYDLNRENRVAFVTHADYSGDIIVPSTILFFNIQYKVIGIGASAFAECTGLTSITIPNSVTSIERLAFKGCTGLTSIIIPKSVTNIDFSAFSGCSGLTSIKVEEGNSYYDSRNDCNAIITTIPNEEYPYDITIPSNTLIAGCSKTIIPNSVTSIGRGAFSGYTGLTSVTIPNSVTSIGVEAFSQCTGLTSVTIPNSVTSIGGGAFAGCTGLTSITIPNSVTSIERSAFSYCTGLTSFIIPNSVTSIGGAAFAGCTGLTSITIPNSVTSIEDFTFQCTGLTSITIPNSVTSIERYAFLGCTGLTFVKVSSEIPCTLQGTAFEYAGVGSSTALTLEVPKGSKEAYQNADAWKNFAVIVEYEDESEVTLSHKLTYEIDGETYKEYDIEEGATITPEAEPTKTGYTFSGWSEIPATMPSDNVTITAKWSINSYKLTYKVDGNAYKETTIEYNSAISPLAAPEKEGYTFSGWSEIPKNMPANDVVVTGSFTINQYTVKFVADGVTIKEDKFDYGSAITAPANPTKDGSVFKGWNPEVDKTVPSHDVTYTALFEGVSGIDDIFLNAETVKVHSIIGQLIKSNATKEDVNSLPSGIYIINGKKVTLR